MQADGKRLKAEKKRAVKLGDLTALRPFRRRGAFSTGR
jgi:hypothetical protein